jgi:DNA topoisomerase-1
VGKNKLVVVESPAKARTIEKILGDDFKVQASMGHVRDLPDRVLGIDVENNFEPKYVDSKSRAKIIKELKKLAKNSTEIYLAPDPDREGEAIAWHLKEILKDNSDANFHRVTFHEITKKAVQKAFETPSEIDLNRVNSQQARRLLDRLVGYKVSPLLWSHVAKKLSAGRVQSVALRIVCEREREIQGFEPKEYWNFIVNLEATSKGSGREFEAKLVKIDGKKFEINNADDAATALADIKQSTYNVESIEVKPQKRNPYPPFITSTLQQAAGGINMSASFAMRVAQELYEGIDMGNGPQGLITYMRTDSFNIAQEAIGNCRDYITNTLGSDYLPPKPRTYKSKSSAQEAHEAIRPTDVSLTPEKVKSYLTDSQLKLYTLIWKRFVASQMSSAQIKRTTIEVLATTSPKKNYTFRTTVSVVTFQGFLKVYKPEKEEEEKVINPVLAELKKDEPCFLLEALNEQKFTEPPPRFSEATLIKELEENGVGRPSTYASIVGTIQQREYVDKIKGRLTPTELGFKVNDFLVGKLPELFEVSFTAKMEEQLDEVEEGKIDWTKMLGKFYEKFAKWVTDIKKIGAPSKEKADAVMELLSKIEKWNEPEKKGRKTYDDQKMYNSINATYEKEGSITEKQWHSLLRFLVTYESQAKDLNKIAEELNFIDDLNMIRQEVADRLKTEKENRATAEQRSVYTDIFNIFADFEEKKLWAEPVKRGRYTFDDKKFVESLKKQTETGKRLSDKQLAALGRIILKYKDHIENDEEVYIKLMGEKPKELKPGEQNSEVGKMITYLSELTSWDEPTKKGRRTFDDKSFYESVKNQFETKGALSPRQVGALKKMVTKYQNKENGNS